MVNKKILLLHDAVIGGAPPDEQDTLVQVSQIGSALRRLGCDVCTLAFDGNLSTLEATLRKKPADLLFNVVETFWGSRFLHTIPLLCAQLGIPITGGNASSLFLTGDKLLAKRLMQLKDIPTPRWVDDSEYNTLSSFLGRTLICKPREEEASVGITDDSVFTCNTSDELRIRCNDAIHRKMIIEEYIEGRECNISIASFNGFVRVFPIAEMIFTDYPEGKPHIVGYEAKWDEQSFAYHHTIRSFAFVQGEPILSRRLEELVLSCWQLFDCSGYGRVDLRIDREGNPFVLEINMNPCLTDDSGFIAACAEASMSYDEVIRMIIEEALRG